MMLFLPSIGMWHRCKMMSNEFLLIFMAYFPIELMWKCRVFCLWLGPSLNRFNRKLACVSTTSPHAIQTQGHFVKNCMAPENLPLDFRMIKILESFYR